LLDKRVLMFQSHTNGNCDGLSLDARLTPSTCTGHAHAGPVESREGSKIYNGVLSSSKFQLAFYWVLTILKSPQKSAIKCLGLEPSMTSSVSLLGVTVIKDSATKSLSSTLIDFDLQAPILAPSRTKTSLLQLAGGWRSFHLKPSE